MRRFRLLPLLLLLTFPLAAQSIDSRAVDQLMDRTLREWHIPGASVAIVRGDKVVYLKGYGVRELGKADPVTPDTLFGIASTTKAFTTTAMAMLVDEKKMSWDDPVRKHLDYFHLGDPCADSLVTMRDIVSHRSGLARHDELWDNTSLTREQVIRAAGLVQMTRPIRTAYQYSNIMFIAAGEAVAATAKMPWDDLVRTRIFEPLGMTRTRTALADFLAAEHATGYRYVRATDSPVVQLPNDDSNLGPAGAIKSSARDMAQWIRFQLADGAIDGRRLVSAEALGETKTPQMVIRSDASEKEMNPETNVHAYGMGWNVQDYRGELLVSHGGALNGFRTQVDLLPSQRSGFVVLINEGRGLATVAVRNALADLLLGKSYTDWNGYYLALDKRLDERDAARRRERDAKKRPDAKPSRELAAYAGRYVNPAYGAATVTLENGALAIHWQRMTLPLTTYNFDTFNARSDADDVDELVTFRIGTDGEVKGMTLFDEPFTRE